MAGNIEGSKNANEFPSREGSRYYCHGSGRFDTSELAKLLPRNLDLHNTRGRGKISKQFSFFFSQILQN